MEYMFKFDAWEDSNNGDVVVTAGSEDSTYFSFHNVKHWQLLGLSNQVTCRATEGEHKILDANWTSKHFQTSFTHRFWCSLVLPQRATEPGTVTDTSGLRGSSNHEQLFWHYRLTFWPFDWQSFKHSTQHVTSEHSLVVAMCWTLPNTEIYVIIQVLHDT